MAEAAVTFLLEQVREMVVVYADVIAGAEMEFMQLSSELSLLQAIVKDVLRPKKYNNLFKELEGQIKDIVFEIEDVFDILLTTAIGSAKAKKSSLRRRLLSMSNRFDLAKEVKSIRVERLMPMLSEAKMKYALVTADESRSLQEDHSRDTTKRVIYNSYSHIRESH